MGQKISTQTAAIIVAVIVIVIVIAGTAYYRKASGADVADQMHAAMSKVKPGQAPSSITPGNQGSKP